MDNRLLQRVLQLARSGQLQWKKVSSSQYIVDYQTQHFVFETAKTVKEGAETHYLLLNVYAGVGCSGYQLVAKFIEGRLISKEGFMELQELLQLIQQSGH